MLKINRRYIQIVLGFLWLFDGLLQLQSKMFTPSFARLVILPMAQGQPSWVGDIIHIFASLVLTHPAVYDLLFASIQIIIGLFFMIPKSVKVGIILSIIWGTLVWVAGEGFGGVFSGHALLLMGAPGAVLLYMVMGLSSWPKKCTSPAYWLAICWLVFWVGGGVYQLLPGQNTIPSVDSMIKVSATDAPSWLSVTDNSIISTLNSLGDVTGFSGVMNMAPQLHKESLKGYIFILIFAGTQIFIGVGVLKPGLMRRLAVSLGILLSLGFWVVGQGLGDLSSGLATDLNSGPIFVLLGIAVLSASELDVRLNKIGSRLEVLLLGRDTNNQEISANNILIPSEKL